jgi:hypothetical protein
MKFSDFCLSPKTAEILAPFINFPCWPNHLQMVLKDTHHELYQKSNLDLNGYIGNHEMMNSLEVMKQVGTDQEVMIEKWLWTKYQSTQKNECLQEFLLYRRAKGCIDMAFDEFFCRQQQEFKKSRFLFYFSHEFYEF